MLKAYENMLHEEVPSLFVAFPNAAIVELLLEAGASPNKPRWQREDRGWYGTLWGSPDRRDQSAAPPLWSAHTR